jgi:Fic family protein
MEPYVPNDLPLENLQWAKYVKYVGQANAELARFDGILQAIINPAVLLSPLSTKEAVLSSKIEGTVATLEDVFAFEAQPDIKSKKNDDIQEILNYRKAMFYATDYLKDRYLNLGVIKRTHQLLLDSVRGQNKTPGSFRSTQNWIGKPGSPIEEASYIPPSPLVILSSLENLEKYFSYEEVDPLVQMAIIHAQFEIIHPFNDGNGRLGRMLIPLFLYQKKIITSPMFYISEYLEEHRSEYYSSLKEISFNNDWDGWILFFLKAIVEQAKCNSHKAKTILDLYESKKKKISELTHSQFAISIIDTIFKLPVFTATQFITVSKIPPASGKRYLNILVERDVLSIVKKGKGRSSTVYMFNKLFEIVK